MSYKKVFFSTYAVIAASVVLIVVLWGIAELRSKYEAHVAEERERIAMREAQNWRNCLDLSNTAMAPKENDLRMKLAYAAGVDNHGDTAGIDDLTHEVRADSDWLEHHALTNVWNDGRGDFYDGMTDEDYAACQARFGPEVKQIQAKQAEETAKKAKETQDVEARRAEAARLAGTDYFQTRRITLVCGGSDGENCDAGQLTVTTNSKFHPSRNQLACALADAKFRYDLFDVLAVNDRGDWYLVHANPWPQDFIVPAGCQP